MPIATLCGCGWRYRSRRPLQRSQSRRHVAQEAPPPAANLRWQPVNGCSAHRSGKSPVEERSTLVASHFCRSCGERANIASTHRPGATGGACVVFAGGAGRVRRERSLDPIKRKFSNALFSARTCGATRCINAWPGPYHSDRAHVDAFGAAEDGVTGQGRGIDGRMSRTARHKGRCRCLGSYVAPCPGAILGLGEARWFAAAPRGG